MFYLIVIDINIKLMSVLKIWISYWQKLLSCHPALDFDFMENLFILWIISDKLVEKYSSAPNYSRI